MDLIINNLRQRGGVDSLTNTLVQENGLDMRGEIHHKCWVELVQEGFRYYYLI